jgi:DNA-binding transcriptional LysR family regulator
MMFELRDLRYATMLARHRNYSRAAEALDMSQPALSRSISRMERALGVRLFDRTRSGVEPTDFGERLLVRGGALLAGAVELERELRLMQGLELGVLRVGAGTYPADLSVGTAIGRLARKHPRLRVELDIGDWRAIVDEVLAAKIDLAVIELSVARHDPRLLTQPLPKHAAAFFCRADHPLLAGSAPTFERLFEFPFAGTKIVARAAEMFRRLARSGSTDPATGDYLPPIRVDSVALAKAVVLSSDAVGLAPSRLIAAEVRAGSLVALPFRQPWLQTRYGFVSLRDRALPPGAQAFMAEVRAVEAALSGTAPLAGSGVSRRKRPARRDAPRDAAC